MTAPEFIQSDCCGLRLHPHARLADEQLERTDGMLVHTGWTGDGAEACRRVLAGLGRCTVAVRGHQFCAEPAVVGGLCSEHAHEFAYDDKVNAEILERRERTGGRQ